MTPERFRQIEELYHEAREKRGDDRAAFLAHADPELRHEIESLLAHENRHLFLDHPAVENSTELLDDSTAGHLVGTCLGPYRIEGKLGKGGMGEVFRAVDTRLGRAVAIKTAHQRFSARFEREARAIASLNHPHICTLYDVGPNYLVMELVEGETIAARLRKGPLPRKTALLYASQIVAALAEAHRKGIIHRDLKPANIMIATSGVKVLDFGLARFSDDETATASRMIMGTPAYMAPEQREGKPADARTDIYAFGLLLYEMLTASRIGTRRRVSIRPRKVDRIISRCLEEDPGRRWQSAAELDRELATAARSKAPTLIAAGLAAILLFSAIAYVYFHRRPKLTGRDTVVLADFENKTGDPVFDQTLRRGLEVQLQQSPFLVLVSDQQIRKALAFMNRPLESRLTPEVAAEICERSGSAAVLEGSIANLGTQYVLWLRARKCRTGDVLVEEQAQAGRKEEVLHALSQIATQMRTRLGESLVTIQEHSAPLEMATTSSLEALKAYSAAHVALLTHGGPAAIPHLQRAIAIDPKLAMAYADLSITYWNMGQTDLSIQYTRKAYEFRDRVSDRERLWILFLYDRQVTGNLPRELQTLEMWVQTYPRDFVPYSVLAGWGTLGTGEYERGIRAAEMAVRLNPDLPFAYSSLFEHNVFLNRFSDAANAMRRASERGIEIPDYNAYRYYLAFLQSDEGGMQREIDRARGQIRVEDSMAHNQALVLARSGRMRQATIMWQRAIDSAQQAGDGERMAIYQAAAAVCTAHFGNAAAAKTRADRALKLARNRDVEYAAAFALALSGDAARSQSLTADIETRFPEDTAVLYGYLPILRALSLLNRGRPLDAIERLQTAVPYDFALPGTTFFAKFGGLYPAYVRGQAFLAAGRGQEAAAEFQKVLDHRGIVLADPIGALAHLQLGRAFQLSGDKGKAKRAYEDFFSIWNDADSDIPVLRQAKAEYARLQ